MELKCCAHEDGTCCPFVSHCCRKGFVCDEINLSCVNATGAFEEAAKMSDAIPLTEVVLIDLLSEKGATDYQEEDEEDQV
jgi:hypothetical protein